MTDKKNNRPLTFNIALWFGYIFSGIFLLYGGVQIVLSFLDRNFGDIFQLIVFTIIGLICIAFVIAFQELKQWGWYGLIALYSLIIIFGLIGYSHYENIIIALLSAGALYTLFSSETKNYLANQA